MLMNVADKFNFKVNTFTHILEGYKVADKMKEHGVALLHLQIGGLINLK
jgi:hypothetical protein